jgi:hypothetical protein
MMKSVTVTVSSAEVLGSLAALVGFFVRYLLGAAGVSFLGDWAWFLPVFLAALAIFL